MGWKTVYLFTWRNWFQGRKWRVQVNMVLEAPEDVCWGPML